MSSQHNFPGVYPEIKDLSQVVASNSITSCGYVGETEFGPINTPTLVTSLKSFTDKFGTLSSKYGYMGYSLAVAADTINSHYVVRVVDEDTARYSVVKVPLKGKTEKITSEGYTCAEIEAAKLDSSALFIDPLGTVDNETALVVTSSNPNNKNIKVTLADSSININKNIKPSEVSIEYKINTSTVHISAGGSGYIDGETVSISAGSTESGETKVVASGTIVTDESGVINAITIPDSTSGVFTKNFSDTLLNINPTTSTGTGGIITCKMVAIDDNVTIKVPVTNEFEKDDKVFVTDSNSDKYEGIITDINNTYYFDANIISQGSGYAKGDKVIINDISTKDGNSFIVLIDEVEETTGKVTSIVLETLTDTKEQEEKEYSTTLYDPTLSVGAGLTIKLKVSAEPNIIKVKCDKATSMKIDSVNSMFVQKQVADNEKTFALSVYEVNGKISTRVEYYQFLTTYENKDNYGNSTFAEDVINNKSSYIYVFVNKKSDTNPEYPEYPIIENVTLKLLAHGTSGNAPTSAALIKGWDAFKDRTLTNVTLLLNSGYVTEGDFSYQSKMLEIAEKRRDCFCLFDTPKTLAYNNEKILDWRKNVQGFNSYRGALTAPWVKTYDSIQGKAGFLMAPSAYVAKIIGTNNPWIAPAGPNRGVIGSAIVNPTGLTESYDDTVGGTMYDAQINCIVRNPGAGWAVWGQKTEQQKPSALDRINVARTVIYLETTLRDAARYHLFENNTAFERMQITLQFNQFLDQVLAAGGLNRYQVICDESNNTAQVIANNTLVIDIYLWPVLTAEYIELNSIIMGQDAEISISTNA